MKTKNSIFKTLILLFLIAVMCFPSGVMAADNTGSISFTAQTTGDHIIVKDAEFELYKVADYDVKTMTLTSDFAGTALTLDDLRNKPQDAANKVDAWVSSHTITPSTTVISGSSGAIAFTNLADGIYLVRYKQDPAKDEIYNRRVTAESVLIAIPYVQGNDFLRTVNIQPKITMSDLYKLTDIRVTKRWDDNNDANRPSSVTVALYDGNTEVEQQVLNANNNWTYEWKDKDSRKNWSVKEINAPAGYTVNVVSDGQFSFTITNKKETPPTPTTITATVKKVWANDTESSRPQSVSIEFLKNGQVVESVVLNASNNWQYTWNNLSATDQYSVKETNVPSGYTMKTEMRRVNNNWEFVVTNTGSNTPTPPGPDEPEEPTKPITVTVEKKGVGRTDPKATTPTTTQPTTETAGGATPAAQPTVQEPTEVSVTLYNGNAEVGTVTLNDANQWRYTWANLDGKGKYTVKENNVPAGYKCDVTSSNNGQNYTFVVTNTKLVPIDLSVVKVWKDEDNKERPLSVTVALYNGDTQIGDVVTLSSGNEWKYTWKQLSPEGDYSVKEIDIPKDYKAEYTRTDDTFTVTNTLSPSTWTDVVTGSDFPWLLYLAITVGCVGIGALGIWYARKRKREFGD